MQGYWGLDLDMDLEYAFGQLQAGLAVHTDTEVHMTFAPAESVNYSQRQYITLLIRSLFYGK